MMPFVRFRVLRLRAAGVARIIAAVVEKAAVTPKRDWSDYDAGVSKIDWSAPVETAVLR